MASTITVPSLAQIANYPPETAKKLIEVATAAKADGDAVQRGTGTLVAGVSAAIAVTITASSRIEVTPKNQGASTAIGRLAAPSADRVVGAPGSFKVRAFKADATAETNDVSTFDYAIYD